MVACPPAQQSREPARKAWPRLPAREAWSRTCPPGEAVCPPVWHHCAPACLPVRPRLPVWHGRAGPCGEVVRLPCQRGREPARLLNGKAVRPPSQLPRAPI